MLQLPQGRNRKLNRRLAKDTPVKTKIGYLAKADGQGMRHFTSEQVYEEGMKFHIT
jgi:hypothetical protein